MCGPHHHDKARGVHNCNIITDHATSEGAALHASNGIDHFFTEMLPEALSVALFRDPRERLLSRYYYDMIKGKTNRGAAMSMPLPITSGGAGVVEALAKAGTEPAGGSWLSTVEVARLLAWIQTEGHNEGPHGIKNHYMTALPLKYQDQVSCTHSVYITITGVLVIIIHNYFTKS